MIRRFAVSASNHLRLSWAWGVLQACGDAPETLLVAPVRGAVDDFVRSFIPDGGGRLGIQRFTLSQLASVLATERLASERLAPLSRLGAEAVAARSVFHLRGQLRYFAPVADTPGFARALESTLTELRMAGVHTDALAATGDPGRDLAQLMAHYDEELRRGGLADLAEVFRLAAEVARSGLHRLAGQPTLFLDVPPASAAERELAAALVERAPAVAATALAGDEEAITAWTEILGVGPENLEDRAPASTLGRVRRYVFSVETPPRRESDESVTFFSAAGEGLECVEIARRIRGLAESGVPFDEVAVLLRYPDDYLPLLEDALRRAMIPAYFTRGALRPDPAGRAFLALLECTAESLSASRFAEYLSLGQVPGAAPEEPAWAASGDDLHAGLKTVEAEKAPATETHTDDDPIIAGTLRAPLAWEKLLVDAAVIGGRDRWARRLKGLEAEFRLRLTEIGDEDEARRKHYQRQLERLRNLEGFALPLIAALDSLPLRATWGEWLAVLEDLARKALREPESVLSTLAELQPMAEIGPVGADEVRQVLAGRLRFLRREPPARRYGRVFVGAIAEAIARSFEVVFLPGLAEGMFPRRISEDPLLLDGFRAQLAGGLEVEPKRLAAERLLLRTAAGVTRSRLLVSYPRIDAMQGRNRVPSFYALEVLRAAEGYLPELRELEKRAALASPSRLGWPAPQDSQDAIDDAEHDLALLAPLLGAPGVRGRGKYLLEANRHLARSLRARGRRWRSSWFDADGIVDPDEATREVLAQHRLAARAYSASTLQHFAACPYRFLLAGLHGLRVREEAAPLEQLDPLTRGALFHAVQFRLFRVWQAAGLLPVNDDNLAHAVDAADQVLDEVAAEQAEELAPAIPRVWRSEIEALRTDLRAWIRQLPAIHAQWRPAHFELGFGLPVEEERDPASTEKEAVLPNGVRLRGSIDLVEIDPAGARLRVTDHKTGKAPAQEPAYVGAGEVLQPLLYALAAEQQVGRPAHSGMLYYCTQRGGYTQVEIPVTDRPRAMLERVLATIDTWIAEGYLPAAPRAEACTYCDYTLVCGPYEETRVRRKKQDRLAALHELRLMP